MYTLYSDFNHEQYFMKNVIQPDLHLTFGELQFELPAKFMFGDTLSSILLHWKAFKLWFKHSLMGLPQLQIGDIATPMTIDFANIYLTCEQLSVLFTDELCNIQALVDHFIQSETILMDQTKYFDDCANRWCFNYRPNIDNHHVVEYHLYMHISFNLLFIFFRIKNVFCWKLYSNMCLHCVGGTFQLNWNCMRIV